MNCSLPYSGAGTATGRKAVSRTTPHAGLSNERRYSAQLSTFNFQPSTASRAFTLIELMVVIVLIGILTAMMIPEMKGTYHDALLRSTGRELLNVCNLAYSRSVSLNQLHRVRLDQRTGHYLIERRLRETGRDEDFIPLQDVAGSEGELDTRILISFRQPEETPVDEDSTAASSAPAEEPKTVPRDALLSFYPDGTADPGEFLLQDQDGFRLLLHINPVTARVRVTELGRE